MPSTANCHLTPSEGSHGWSTTGRVITVATTRAAVATLAAKAEQVGVAFAGGRGAAPGDDQGSARHGRDRQGSEQEDHHNVTPDTPTASSPTSNHTRYEDGLRVCARSLAMPAQRVATTVPRT